jgi:cardiolipin synthase
MFNDFLSSQTTFLSVLHVVLAAGVTTHVLLTKRDTSASIGWIGLALLSPIVGSVIYFLFGINRVRRRAQQLRDQRLTPRTRGNTPHPRDSPHHLDGLRRTGALITERRIEAGNSVALLRDGDAAYPQMLQAIQDAERSIALSSYILRSDKAGDPFISALAAAQQRGVAVRVLVDGIGSGYFYSGACHHLRAVGVPVAQFLHSSLPWRMPFLNMRTHKKILVVDGRVGFAGGLNIGAENLVATRPRSPVRDTHFRFDGPVIEQLLDAFIEDWLFATGETLEGDAWACRAASDGAAAARVVTSGPDQDLEKVEFIILQAISCAQSSIRVMTPYFLPDERVVTALALAAMRGVSVEILVPTRSNRRIVDWATRTQIEPLLDAGCRLSEANPPFDHSKLMTVDGIWCLIGSANWDMRSFRLNFELNVEIYLPSLAEQLDALMTASRRRSLSHDELRARTLPIRLRDAAARLALPYL